MSAPAAGCYLTAFSGGAQQERFEGGAHTLAERLAAALDPPVLLGVPVRRVRLDAGPRVLVEGPGLSLAGGHAVLAVPPGMAARIDVRGPGGAPTRPVARPPAGRGSAVKLHLVYERPFWREAGLSGWAAGDRGPVRFTVDDSAGRGGAGVLIGFVTGGDARRWAATPPAERRRAVLARVTRWFGPEAGEPVAFLQQDWQAEEFVEGCWAAVPEFGAWTTPRPAPGGRERDGGLHFCGTEHSGAFYGHLEGAVRSGRAVAARVLGAPAGEAAP
ncbi:flavin monoamine oxidase family protein [Streptomyces litchfieldiae]|uniref:FAD-dependent oxidoreductase n=1 Tax=Streptomyces litchfieldiae TaxID=3075543 RepID=A0ABU2MR28_9ACTN|nr:FAD-dependent oxidoreductase [Streptomyces sp. DSM 44938]MDT0343990.1 FAD-dependent oxidoreductase [Streptomyces sp. DSM 44938]